MDPTQQSNQTPSEVITPQPKPNYLKTIIFSILGVILFALITFLYKQNQQLNKQSVNQQISPTPLIVSSISVPPDETADWKTYTSSCGFSIKYSDGWNAQKFFIQDSISSCAFLTAPDYKQGSDTRSGFSITLTRLLKGSTNQNVNYEAAINTTEDYIKSIESLQQPLVSVKNKRSALYESLSGTQFDYDTFESITTFVFLQDNYFWIISWPNTSQYNGQYRGNLDQILSTFKFVDKDCQAGSYLKQCKLGPCCCPVGAICD